MKVTTANLAINKTALSDREAISRTLSMYCYALHHGDTEALRQLLTKETNLQAPGLRLSRDQWLERVANRVSPAAQGAPFHYSTRAIDQHPEHAMATVDCPLYDHRYVDFLSLLKINNKWLIVNKLYGEQAATQ